MNDAAAPLREEVRSHKVAGALWGLKSGIDIPRDNNEASQAKRNETAHTSGSGDLAALTQLDNGKIRLDYSVDRHTSYIRSVEKRGRDPQLFFGHTASGWNRILFNHQQMKWAAASTIERQEQLDNTVKERLLFDVRASGVRADLLNVSGTSKYMTRWETVAVCALLTIPNLRLKDTPGKDLGRGIFRLGKEFGHIEMAVLPHYDTSSLYTAKAAMKYGGEYGRYQFFVVYKNVRSDAEFLALRNAMFTSVNRNQPADFVYRDGKSMKNVNDKYIRVFGLDADKYGAEYSRTCSLLFTPARRQSGQGGFWRFV